MTTPSTVAKAPVETKSDPKMPATANEVLAAVDEDHDWKHDPADLTSTGGIQKAVERNRDAIAALANYIDGKK